MLHVLALASVILLLFSVLLIPVDLKLCWAWELSALILKYRCLIFIFGLQNQNSNDCPGDSEAGRWLLV